MSADCNPLPKLEGQKESLAPLAEVPARSRKTGIDRIFSAGRFLANGRTKTMLIYTEVALAEISTGDHIALKIGADLVTGYVVDTNSDRGLLAFEPLTYSEPTENGTGFRVRIIGPFTEEARIFTISPGEDGVRLLKAIDSEAAITEPLTWEHIAVLEPQVLDLVSEIKDEHPSEANHLFLWRKYKERLCEMVGWDRESSEYPELRSSMAYDIVYDVLLHALRQHE